jgi:hypothetical protein
LFWVGPERTIPLFLVPFAHPKKLARCSILFAHGNGEDLGLCADQLRVMSEQFEANIFAIDYPGYGRSLKLKIFNFIFFTTDFLFIYFIIYF